MPRNELLETEKKVLYGLVKYPNKTDRELAQRLSMKTSTVAALRRKLHKDGYCANRRIPFLQDLNCEMMMVSYLRLSSSPSSAERLKKARDVLNREEFVYGISEPKQDCLIQMARNYTDAKRNMEDLEKIYRENDFLEEETTSIPIPYGLSDTYRYFDFDSALHKAFWPEEEYEKEDMPYFQQIGNVRLRQKEGRIFRGFCEFPSLNDVELSEELGVSRMTVGRARKKFFGMGVLSEIVIPDLGKVGFELLTLTHGKFNPELTEGLKHYLPKLTEIMGPTIFLSITRDEMVMMSAFRNFTDYKRSMNHFAETYKERDLFSSPANSILFSTHELKTVKNHDYGPIVGKALDLPSD
jgi:DNA-binding Lrp family transcriptional regulator